MEFNCPNCKKILSIEDEDMAKKTMRTFIISVLASLVLLLPCFAEQEIKVFLSEEEPPVPAHAHERHEIDPHCKKIVDETRFKSIGLILAPGFDAKEAETVADAYRPWGITINFRGIKDTFSVPGLKDGHTLIVGRRTGADEQRCYVWCQSVSGARFALGSVKVEPRKCSLRDGQMRLPVIPWDTRRCITRRQIDEVAGAQDAVVTSDGRWIVQTREDKKKKWHLGFRQPGNKQWTWLELPTLKSFWSLESASPWLIVAESSRWRVYDFGGPAPNSVPVSFEAPAFSADEVLAMEGRLFCLASPKGTGSWGNVFEIPTPRGELKAPRLISEFGNDIQALTGDPDGHLWVARYNRNQKTVELLRARIDGDIEIMQRIDIGMFPQPNALAVGSDYAVLTKRTYDPYQDALTLLIDLSGREPRRARLLKGFGGSDTAISGRMFALAQGCMIRFFSAAKIDHPQHIADMALSIQNSLGMKNAAALNLFAQMRLSGLKELSCNVENDELVVRSTGYFFTKGGGPLYRVPSYFRIDWAPFRYAASLLPSLE